MIRSLDAHVGGYDPIAEQEARISHEDLLTVGGQMQILQVMLEEEVRSERAWKEEAKCATALLLASATQGPVPDEEDKNTMEAMRRARLVGAYAYQSDITMEDVFGKGKELPYLGRMHMVEEEEEHDLISFEIPRGAATNDATTAFPQARTKDIDTKQWSRATERVSNLSINANKPERRYERGLPGVANPWDRKPTRNKPKARGKKKAAKYVF